MIPAIVKKLFVKDEKDEKDESGKNVIYKSKLDIKTARTFGGAIYLALTGYLESGNKYVVEKKIYKRKDRKIVEIIIQSVDDAKYICQSWNEIKCENCDFFSECKSNSVE
jgi:hypothetical protein